MKSQLNDLKINFFPRVGFVNVPKINEKLKEDGKPKRGPLTKEEKESNAKLTPISVFISIGKNPRIRIPGIAKVAPEDWIDEPAEKGGQRVRISNAAKDMPKKRIAERINSEIDNATKAITDVFNEHIAKYAAYPTDLEAFKVKCINRIKGIPDFEEVAAPVSNSFFKYIENYIKDAKSGKRKIKANANGKPYSERSIKGYTTTLNTIKEFRKQSGHKDLEFDEVTINFYQNFESYVESKKYSKNYFGSFIKYIKKFMRESLEEGLHNNTDFQKKGFEKVSAKSDSIALSISQLQSLASFDFSYNPCYDNARDFFLVGCWTGLRYSDFSKLTRDYVDGGYIDIVTQKTGQRVAVPILPELRKILDKYKHTDTGFPRAISDVKLNEYIKEICRIVGEESEDKSFIRTNTTVFRRADKDVIVKEPLYKKISSHTGRRSFATNAVRLKVSTEAIKQITGHKTDAAFFKYVKIESREHADTLRNAFFAQEMEVVNGK